MHLFVVTINNINTIANCIFNKKNLELFEIKKSLNNQDNNIELEYFRLWMQYMNTSINWGNMPGSPPMPDCCIL